MADVSLQTHSGYSLRFRCVIPSLNTYTTAWGDKDIQYGDDLKVVWEKGENEFYYRMSLDGKLKLVGTLAKKIVEDMDPDEYVNVELAEDFVPSVGDPLRPYSFSQRTYFRFSRTDCDISVRVKIDPVTSSPVRYYVISVTPKIQDRYTNVLDHIDKEFDLIKLKVPTTKISYYRRPCLQMYIPESQKIANFLGGNYWETPVNFTVGNQYDLNNKYVFRPTYALFEVNIEWVNTGSQFPYPGAEGTYRAAIKLLPTISVQPNNNFAYPLETEQFMYLPGENSSNFTFRVGIKSTWDSSHSYEWWNMKLYNSGGTVLYTSNAQQVTSASSSGNCGLTQSLEMYNVGSGYLRFHTFLQPLYIRWYLPSDNFISHASRVFKKLPTEDIAPGNYKWAGNLDVDSTIVCGTNGPDPTEYGKNSSGEYFERPGIAYVPLLQSSWGDWGWWLDRTDFNSSVESSSRELIYINDGYRLTDVLSYLFSACHYNSEDPNDFTTLWSITSTLGTLGRIYLTPKSNITRGQYDLPAQKAPITLRKMLDFLRDVYGYYWYISAANTAKIESRSYFLNNSIEIDLTDPSGIKNPRNGRSWGWSEENLKVNAEEIPERISYSWMDPCTEPFNGCTEINLGHQVKADEAEEINVGDFNPDIDYMVISPGECSNDGFAIFHAASAITRTMIGTVSMLGITYTVQNPYQAFGYRQHYNLMEYRPTPTYRWMYDDPDNILNALSLKPTAEETLKFPFYLFNKTSSISQGMTIPQINWYGKVATLFGDGHIKRVTIPFVSRLATIEIEHTVEYNE